MNKVLGTGLVLAGLLWGTVAMAQPGVGKCLWEALPDSKLAALTMPEEQYGGADGSMINVVGIDPYIAAFEKCAVLEEYGGFSGQALDQYVSQLRAERTLASRFSADALGKAFQALPESDLRIAENLDGEPAERETAARKLDARFLAELKAETSPELKEYLRARISVFNWEVLMPEVVEAALRAQR